MKTLVPPLALLVLLLGCPATATEGDAEPVTFDHTALSSLLGETVEGGRVDYDDLKKKQARLDAYLATLADAKPELLIGDDALAFWINSYNAFTGKDLPARLAQETRRFLADQSKGAKVILAEDRPPVLMLSLLFKWFADDFRKSSGSVLEFVLPYLPDPARSSLAARQSEVQIRYFDYDWSLNRR